MKKIINFKAKQFMDMTLEELDKAIQKTRLLTLSCALSGMFFSITGIQYQSYTSLFIAVILLVLGSHFYIDLRYICMLKFLNKKVEGVEE